MPKSKFQRWLYGDELVKRWNASPLDIWSLMCEEKLIPYNIVTFDRVYVNNKPEFLMLSELNLEEFRHGIANLGFRLEDIELFEKEQDLSQPDNSHKSLKLRPNQIAKEKCRSVAEKIWKDKPNITIEDMIKQDDIFDFTKKKDGSLYLEKTVRNWIKDLCPNRKGGRRPKVQ